MPPSSNLIFTPPSGPGAYGSWAWPIKKTPMFKTLTQTPTNLRNEVRLSETPFPIWLYDYDFSYLKGAEYIPNTSQNSGLAYLLGFFGQVLGSANSFLLNDPFDNSVTNEPFGCGDGASTQFQLIRSINGLFPDIIQNPNSISSIAVGGGALTPISSNGYYIGLENLLNDSQAFSTTPTWYVLSSGGVGNPTLTGGQTAPDGTSTAFQVAYPSTASNQEVFLAQNITGVAYASQTVTFSIWLKAASAVSLNLGMEDYSPYHAGTSSAVSVTTSWQRFSLTFTFPPFVTNTNPSAGFQVYFGLFGSAPATTVFAWGAQVERNTNASGYILTTNNAPVVPNGVVTFNIPPAVGEQLTWSGTFYNRCRFDEDQLDDLKQFMYQIWELDSLKFRSVILGDV